MQRIAGHAALLAAAIFTIISEARAADLGRVQPYVYQPLVPLAYDWSGWHVGITAGGAFDGHNPSFSFENVDAASVAILPHEADPVVA
jgi:hypothetical protein